MGRPIGGGDGSVVSAADGTGSFVAIPKHARQFWIHSSADSWVDVRSSDDADTLEDTNAAPIAGGSLYGPFDLQQGVDTHIATAGNGGTATVTITFAT
jgi:hypothetical protein